MYSVQVDSMCCFAFLLSLRGTPLSEFLQCQRERRMHVPTAVFRTVECTCVTYVWLLAEQPKCIAEFDSEYLTVQPACCVVLGACRASLLSS
uniref:Uncharacterized protein n=1 Tax=Rhipicephalus microplus TaxID=6941 RepID=A0A6G5A382_RHIMP